MTIISSSDAFCIVVQAPEMFPTCTVLGKASIYCMCQGHVSCACVMCMCHWTCPHISASSPPISASSIHSSNRHDFSLPRVRTTMAQTRSFASIGPSLWNHIPESASAWLIPWEALYKYLCTIKYNKVWPSPIQTVLNASLHSLLVFLFYDSTISLASLHRPHRI